MCFLLIIVVDYHNFYISYVAYVALRCLMQHSKIRNQIIRENICLALYTKDFQKEEISPIFYEKRNTRIKDYIEELIDEGWIKEEIKQFGIKRFHYCRTTPKCLIDVIKKALEQNNQYLIGNEDKRLEEYFKSFGFKEWYNDIFLNLFTHNERKGSYPINGFSTFLEILCFRFIIYEQYANLDITPKKLLEIINKIRKEKLPPDLKIEKKSLSEYDILGLIFLGKLKNIIPKVKVDFYEGMIEVLINVTEESKNK